MTPEFNEVLKSRFPGSRCGNLIRLHSTNNNLRTNVTHGRFLEMPRVGASFRMVSDALTPGADFRSIATSSVVTVNQDGDVITFTTLNSKYQLELLP